MKSRAKGGPTGAKPSSWRQLATRTVHLWPWLLTGIAVTVAVSSLTWHGRHLPPDSVVAGLSWWQTPSLLAPPLIGAILTAIAAMVAHRLHVQELQRDDGHLYLRQIAQALEQMTTNPRSAWRTLSEARIIDGYALWDASDRLVECKCFLSHYLPQLKDWREPTARQVATALIDGGQLVLPPGQDRADAIDLICERRRQVPGLREFRMSTGEAYLARTVDLGHGYLATIYGNVTDLRARADGMLGDDAYRLAFDLTPSPKLMLDAEFRPLAVNRAATQLLGLSLDSLSSRGWLGLLPADEAPPAPPWSPGPRRLVTAAGKIVHVIVGVQELGSHTGGRWLVSLDDVTADTETEKQLRLEAAVLEHERSATLAVDQAGRVIFGNRAALALFQWSGNVLPGTPVERLLGAPVRAALADGGTEVETDGCTWNGSTFPAQVVISYTHADPALANGAVLVVSDLTQRRTLDLQLMHSARLATLGEMAASIAHEFNQCLHVIRLASEAVQMDLDDNKLDKARLAKRSENILNQVDRLTEMVTHMRVISRREGQEKQPFSPQAAVNSAVRMVEPLLKADGIALVRDGSLGNALVLGHQVRLEQVLLNLLNNSRDAIRERYHQHGNSGGAITVTCAQSGGQVSISVRDDGTGIPATIGEHIFEAFVTTKQGGAGLGLGLSISRGICADMGGALRFRNVEGGAEFCIELPLAAAAMAEETAPPSVSHSLPSPQDAEEAAVDNDQDGDDQELADDRRILLVDDEALSVMMVSEFLHRQGYQVDTAYDGLEAYELCLSHVYHVVITDIRMPRMNGHELIAKLEELQPGTPVIVVTGHLKEGNAAELGSNVAAVLTKPFQLQRLRDQLLLLEEPNNDKKLQEEGV
jgi:signal transduction histidine kinase/CheY-like chemotaxis protein